ARVSMSHPSFVLLLIDFLIFVLFVLLIRYVCCVLFFLVCWFASLFSLFIIRFLAFFFCFFFFSSRRRHTRSKRDWSSDVCSSDLTFNILNFEVVILLANHFIDLSFFD